ncbi:sulfotransferase [Halothece sp. PCC 7418]|uniref:sulfotransferase family protein n=1 Tax=Halothece sp. (strain PCC 7418) TaxID=65093 RepID=UPI0002A073CD|nr:sulfotransferase [Halothece sp. PCC 7418]AFZ43436.1 sulfotransferase [Halothece sp. PCC 7418]
MFNESSFFKDVKPLFILGVPRSGTTFLQQVINTHPQILITDELRVVSWIFQEARKLRGGFQENGDPYPFNHGEEFASYLTKNCGTIIAPFYFSKAQKLGKQKILYWGDKYPHYHAILDQMLESFPRGSYIFIYRDLKDVICSVKNGHGWNVEKSANYVCKIYEEYMTSFDKFLQSQEMARDQLICVDYVRLSTNLKQESQKIFDQLNLDLQESTLEEIDQLSGVQSHSLRKEKSSAKKFNFNQSNERWKKELNDEEIELISNKIDNIQHWIDYYYNYLLS